MDELLQDIRYVLRMLRRTKAVTAVAIITLALGIGANTAIFSVVRGILFKPLPYDDARNTMMLWSHWKGWDRTWVSPNEFLDYAAQSQIFSGVAAIDNEPVTVTGDGEPQRVELGLVSASLFSVVGAHPMMGRVPNESEDRPGAARVAVLGEALWRRSFNADQAILGKTVLVNGRPFTVVGVMPASFRLPTEFSVEERTQLWTPLQLATPDPNERGNHGLLVVGRVRPGIEPARAQSMLNDFIVRMKKDNAQFYGPEFGVTMVSLHDEAFGTIEPALYILLGAVALVLLIACGNVANLLLARGESRQREIAIRTALGANRKRMVRQLLTESLILSLVGGVAGVVLAGWGVDALPAINPTSLPRAESIGIDLPVLFATLILSILTGLVFGLVPAWQMTRGDHQPELREGNRSATVGRERRAFRRVLIGAEVALAVVLVIGAGLLMKSFVKLSSVSPGFESRGVLTMRISLPATSYPTRTAVRSFYDRFFGEVRRLPGVEYVGAVAGLPLASTRGDWGVAVEGFVPKPGEGSQADFQVASADYFKAMGIPLKRGRFLTDADREGSAPVIIINEAMAKHYWPGRDPVGLRMRLRAEGDSAFRTVVGIVGDVRHRGLTEAPRVEMFLPDMQLFYTSPDSVVGARAMTLTIRTHGDPAAMAAPVRRVLSEIDRGLAVSDLRTLDDVVSRAIAAPRFTAALLAVFAAVALLLATVGIYGVVAFVVAQRTTELGIRVALGAGAADVLRLVIGQGMQPVLIGLASGVVGALALSRVLSRLLYGVTSTDTLTYVAVTLLLGTVALVACWLPARRAARTDPMVALRSE